jgi:hypothetical protein
MNFPHTSSHYRGRAHSREHSDCHEQGLQERLSRLVRSYVNRAAPRKNSAACLDSRRRHRLVGRSRSRITLAAVPIR